MRLLAFFALLTASDPALAQSYEPPSPDDERARELYQNGAVLYEEGRYEDAILAWQEAYRLSARPILLYNIASALERLGRWQEALDTLYRYRAFAPANEREVLDRRMRNIERRIAEEKAMGTTRPPPKDPGLDDPVKGPKSDNKGKSRVFPVVMFGVGAAGLTSGTVFGLDAMSARNEARALCVSVQDELSCPAEAADALERDRLSSWLADGSFALGAIAVGVGTVALVKPISDHATLAPMIGPGTGGLRYATSF